uniref:Uncharacterized protein n=1 Tax=Brassica oleracea TaxID=3712 RepID=A0A3P6E887_BRAOL|nr:unnamed protein product [Brassica oleracea]
MLKQRVMRMVLVLLSLWMLQCILSRMEKVDSWSSLRNGSR